jgi:hypothetical protein
MTRAEALATAAGIIAKSVSDLSGLILVLDCAGQRRLARALRGYVDIRPPEIGGEPRPDATMWRSGRLR